MAQFQYPIWAWAPLDEADAVTVLPDQYWQPWVQPHPEPRRIRQSPALFFDPFPIQGVAGDLEHLGWFEPASQPVYAKSREFWPHDFLVDDPGNFAVYDPAEMQWLETSRLPGQPRPPGRWRQEFFAPETAALDFYDPSELAWTGIETVRIVPPAQQALEVLAAPVVIVAAAAALEKLPIVTPIVSPIRSAIIQNDEWQR